MQMDIIVETQEEFNKYIAEQKNWMQQQAAATPAAVTASIK
jgi:heme/copper-type cytochrome/quinol oxidase subunit 2